MYKSIIAIIVIVLILSLSICDQVFIHKSFTELHDRALEIENYIISENYPTALIKTNDLIEWWRKRRDILELTSPHNEVKDHVNFIAQLQGYLVTEQYDNAIVTAYAIREDAHNKLNILAYRLKNVF